MESITKPLKVSCVSWTSLTMTPHSSETRVTHSSSGFTSVFPFGAIVSNSLYRTMTGVDVVGSRSRNRQKRLLANVRSCWLPGSTYSLQASSRTCKKFVLFILSLVNLNELHQLILLTQRLTFSNDKQIKTYCTKNVFMNEKGLLPFSPRKSEK